MSKEIPNITNEFIKSILTHDRLKKFYSNQDSKEKIHNSFVNSFRSKAGLKHEDKVHDFSEIHRGKGIKESDFQIYLELFSQSVMRYIESEELQLEVIEAF